MIRWLGAVLMLATLALPARAADPITIFAAASLKNVIDDAAAAYTARTGTQVRASYASSAVLAKQIEQDAPADIFASADLEWMDYLEQRKRLRPATRVELLGNALVLIAPKSSPLASLKLDRDAFLAALGPDGKLATGNVASVPAGKYAKEALAKLGLWSELEPRVAGVDNVRAALTFVARGEAPLGIVYATDAAVERNVKIVATFPENSHPPIIYPFAIVKDARGNAAAFLDYLKSSEAGATFEKAGFRLLAQPRQTN